MKYFINNYWSAIFSFTVMILASQLIACDQIPANTGQAPAPAKEEKIELSEGFPLKQQGDGLYRMSVEINHDKLFLEIDENKFSIKDEKGNKVRGCSECTKEIQNHFNLNKDCEGAKEQYGFEMCDFGSTTHHCSANQCEYTFSGISICRDCLK